MDKDSQKKKKIFDGLKLILNSIFNSIRICPLRSRLISSFLKFFFSKFLSISISQSLQNNGEMGRHENPFDRPGMAFIIRYP